MLLREERVAQTRMHKHTRTDITFFRFCLLCCCKFFLFFCRLVCQRTSALPNVFRAKGPSQTQHALLLMDVQIVPLLEMTVVSPILQNLILSASNISMKMLIGIKCIRTIILHAVRVMTNAI